MEIAACLAKNGLEPTVVFPGPFLLARMFTPELAQFYEGYFENKGVTFLKSDSAVSFEGTDGKVGSPTLPPTETPRSRCFHCCAVRLLRNSCYCRPSFWFLSACGADQPPLFRRR